MLGVLKAGGAFCSLDISHPDDRLAEMISDTKAPILLASPAQATRLMAISPIPVLELSEDLISKLDLTTEPHPRPSSSHSNASPANLMYAIFTSGSTGRPKGVMTEHAAWLTSALAYGPDQGISHSSRVLQFASYAFDMSLMEIFTTLVFGGCVCVPADEDRFNIDNIHQFVNACAVNTLMLTPSYAKLLDPVVMPGVKTLITGGEAVPRSLLERWNPHVETYIAYGPTEASIQAAGAKFQRKSCLDVIPSGWIGQPTGCKAWVVHEDDDGTLVAPGQVGELLIGGHTLARGYLGDDAKKNAAFAHVAFSGHDSSRRVFRTGDLVREDEQGNLIFVGRKDTQIKVQGQRFEVSEIETRLSSLLPPGSKCCVEKVDSESGLAAFISTSIGAVLEGKHGTAATKICWEMVDDTVRLASGIREELAKVLPMPMVPSLYIPVTTIPLTTSHKVDRKELRRLVQGLSYDETRTLRRGEQMQTDDGEAGTLTTNESTLRDMWALILDISVDTIKLGDNFIQLGGDSVACIRLISAARSRGLRLTSTVVLGTPILREQAQKIQTSAESSDQGYSETTVQPFSLLDPGRVDEVRAVAGGVCKVSMEEIEDVLPMSIAQMRWYGKTLVSPEAWIDQYHFQLPSDVDLHRFKQALYSAVEAADLLRARAVVTRDRKLFQAILKYRRPDIVSLDNVSLESFLQRDLQNSMGPGEPLSRYTLLQSANDSNKTTTMFIWTIHHAIYDGYSLPMLLQVIEEFYLGGNPTPLTPFSHYLKPPSGQAIVEGTAFWKRYLQETADLSWTKFPVMPDPAPEEYAPSMARIQRRLDFASVSKHVSSLNSTRSNITTANLIRVAYALALLRSASSQNDTHRPTTALFIETLSGRNAAIPGIDRITGPTMINIPTRIRVPLDSDLSQVLATEQACLADRMAHENFPLPLLLPLAPAPLELRNVLMIEDAAAFSIRGSGGGLFGRGTEVLKLDETEQLPMIFRCMIDGRENIEMDMRFDQRIVSVKTMDEFLERFVEIFKEL